MLPTFGRSPGSTLVDLNTSPMKLFLTLVLLMSCFACDEDCEPQKDCIDKTLAENNMVPYAGQELGCNFYLTLFNYDGEQYFLLNNNCIDQVFYPFNCDGTILCEDSLTEECERFYTEAKLIGVVGIDVQ